MTEKKFLKLNSYIVEITKSAMENNYFMKQSNPEEMARVIATFIKTLDDELFDQNSKSTQAKY